MWIGLDIGGANLKASDGDRRSRSLPFSLWKQPQRLPAALAELLSGWERWTGLAVTMTAELADCFATKAEGVHSILTAVEGVARGRKVVVWQTGGEFLSVAEAREFPRLVAAANWHALATWAGRLTTGSTGLLIDMGSTTTDIIPLADGVPAATGWTDLERLQASELVYFGVRRTPLCALAEAVEVDGERCRLAAELFATTLDLYLLSGDLPEDAVDRETADGRAATRTAARNRLAHMVCGDRTELSDVALDSIASQLRAAAERRVGAAVETVASRLWPAPDAVLVSGEGEFLAQRVIASTELLRGAEVLSLNAALGTEPSAAACAFALARLAVERA